MKIHLDKAGSISPITLVTRIRKAMMDYLRLTNCRRSGVSNLGYLYL